MPSIRARNDRYEIRECRTTQRGPRQFALARFRRVLTADGLDDAAATAARPFDRERLLERARAAGIPVSPGRRQTAARQLLGELRAGRPIDPVLVGLLQQALALMPAAPLPEHLEDAADWIARSEAERGRALRGLSRTASRIAQSRDTAGGRDDVPFPRFSSVRDSGAA